MERKRNRMAGFDYSRDALYFVTSCTLNRVCHFGNIAKGVIELNEYGQIAHNQWNWLFEQYRYIFSHEFIVMPNHIHAIIEIDSSCVDIDINVDDYIVETGRDLSLQKQQNQQKIDQRPTVKKIKSLSELIGAYKTTTSKQIHLAGNKDFAWQRSFHDHIIRDFLAFTQISSYIRSNPQNWKDDSFFLKYVNN